MNIQRLNTIAEWLEGGAKTRGRVEGFNMGEGIVFSGCNTVCCIAGAAVEFFFPAYTDGCIPIENDEGKQCILWPRLCDCAQSLLDLDEDTAEELFVPDCFEDGCITPAWAARCIRNLIETGEVDWVDTEFSEEDVVSMAAAPARDNQELSFDLSTILESV